MKKLKNKILYSILLLFVFYTSNAQDVSINGSCVVGTQLITFQGDTSNTTLNGNPVYYTASLDVNYQSQALTTDAYIYYALASELSTAENRWVIAFGGQPYYYFISDATTAPIGEYLPFDSQAATTDCGGSVFITVPCTLPSVPTISASSNSICNGNSTTLSITGSLNDATNWAIYTDSCGGTLVGSTIGSTFDVTPLSTTTYYIRGEGGCVTPASCGSVAITVNTTPTVSIATPSLTCEGSTLTLNGTVTPVPAPTTSFIGAYDVANWTFTNSNADGSIDTTGAPNSIALTSGNNGSSSSGNTNYTINIVNDTTISFDWAYSTSDGAQFDIPRVIVNGTPINMTGYDTAGSSVQSGTMSIPLNAGDTFTFNMFTVDNVFGPATVVISNFNGGTSTSLDLLWTATNGGTIVGANNQLNVDVTTTGTYTLTATNGTCVSSNFVDVTFTPNVTPTFDPISDVCSGTLTSPLPTTSTNGITGTWSPAFDNTTTTEYTFTPDSGQCATTITLTVGVTTTAPPTLASGNPLTADITVTMTGGCSFLNGVYNYIGVLNGKNNYAFSSDPTLKIGYDGVKWALYAADDFNNTGFESNTILPGLLPPTTGWFTTQCGPGNLTYTINANQTLVEGSTLNNVDITGTNIQWYDAATNGNLLPGSTVLVDGMTYYATQTVNGCESVTASVTITLTPAATGVTNVQASQCGITLSAYNSIVYANLVPGAQAYRFRVTHLGTNQVITKDYVLRNLYLSSLSFFQYNQAYSIEVAVKRNNIWEAYGSSCVVTTVTPTTQVRASQCGSTISYQSTNIYADIVSVAGGYRFRVVNLSTSSVQIIDKPLRVFSFSEVTDYMIGTTYNVDVAVKNTDGTYLPYGDVCTITTLGSVPITNIVTRNSDENSANIFKVIAYPNPFDSGFKLNFSSTSNSRISIVIYDMIGKQVDSRTISSSEISDYEIGTNLMSGVYNIIVTQNDNFESIRMIKR